MPLRNLLRKFPSAYYFLHINKTGGSSLNHIFRGIFPRSLICPAGLANDLAAIPLSRLSSYKYYSGHFGLSLPLMLPWIKRVRLRTFTVLRDPVNRSLSQLNAYFRTKQSTYCSDFVRSVECDVEKCLQNDRIVAALSNYQSKSLAVPIRLVQLSSIRQYGLSFQELLAQESRNFTEEELFERAVRSIQGFCFVGLTEKMDESYNRLCNIISLPPLDSVPKVNVSAVNPLTGLSYSLSRVDVSASVVRKLQEINKIDMKLYDRVVGNW